MLRVPSVALVRVLSLGVAAAAAAGLFVAAPVTSSPAVAGIVATDSAITIPWSGSSGDATVDALQPDRSSVPDYHVGDFKDLKVTVSQTKKISDQAIRIDFEGLDATKSGTSSGNDVANAMNYMQFMQCWGNPKSETFRNTCEWGGFAVTPFVGMQTSIPAESNLRGPKTSTLVDEVFISAQGKSYSGVQAVDPATSQPFWPLGSAFDGASTNEIVAAPMGSSLKGTVNFDVQSGTKAPQLGCGSSSQSQRCYIVAVPRGEHFGGETGEGKCSQTASDRNGNAYTAGRADSVQEGSPLSRECNYWANRIVIPLDFTPIGDNCPSGSANQRTIGSQLVVSAMSSWQPALCQSTPNVYNLSTNPDGIARTQLLSAGAGLAFTSYTPEDDMLSSINATKLSKTAISYAPVSISGVSIAFLYEDPTGQRTTLNLTPRIVAKLLTESYRFQNPLSYEGGIVLNLPAFTYTDFTDPELPQGKPATGPYRYFTQDPEFRAANPELTRFVNPALILPGPAGADAITQLWKWVQADDAAKAWLDGAPDENGMRVNPFYLPAGDENAKVPEIDPETGVAITDGSGATVYRAVGLANVDGSPLRLSETTRDFFARADESAGPAELSAGQKTRFTSLQSAPFADTLHSAARSAARADPGSKTVWDPNKINQAGDKGDWVSSGAQLPGQKFTIAITDTASAESYGLSQASLCPADTACVPYKKATEGTPAKPAIVEAPAAAPAPATTTAPAMPTAEPTTEPTPESTTEPTPGAAPVPAPVASETPAPVEAPAAEEPIAPAPLTTIPAVEAVPGTPEVRSTFVTPSTETMTAALDSLAATKNPAVRQVDPASTAKTAYPLAIVTYAAVNMTLTNEVARAAYGEMITYVVTEGQVPGIDRGQLPRGYVPLPTSMVQESLVAVQTMLGYVTPVADSPSLAAPASASGASVPAASSPLQAAAAAAAAAPQTTVTTVPSTAVGTTAAVGTPLPLQGMLGVALIVGLAGAAFAPVLMRPRRPIG
jgi:hypothetical protein